MVWGPQWRGLHLTLACIKIGKNTFSAFSAMAFKGNRFNGQLQTTTKLFNGTLQCYDSALLFRKRWFLLFGNNPFPLLIRKSCVPNFLRDQRPQYLSARLDLSEDTIMFTLCLRGKKRREARNCSPVCCHFFSPYTFPIFWFTSVLRISKQWKLAAGWEKRESCVLSAGKTLGTNSVVLSTWKELIEKHCLQVVFWSLGWGIHG